MIGINNGTSLHKDNLPPLSTYTLNGVEYVKQNLEYLKYRLRLHQGEQCTSIAFITDIHNGTDSNYNMYHPDSKKNSNNRDIILARAVHAIKLLAKNFKINACILGGDYIQSASHYIGKDNPKSWIGEVNTQIKHLINQMRVIICRGNHDGNSEHAKPTITEEYSKIYPDPTIDIKEYSEIVQNGINGGDFNSLYKDYGYFDIPDNKLRVIWLNAHDIPLDAVRNTAKNDTGDKNARWSTVADAYDMQNRCFVGQEQLDFLISALKFDTSGWAVIIFSHQNIFSGTQFTPQPKVATSEAQILGDIMHAFRTKTKYIGTYTPNQKRLDGSIINELNLNIQADFTQNKSNEYIGSIIGHHHSNSVGVNGLTIGGKLTFFPFLVTEALFTTPSRNTGVNGAGFDVITIDRKNKKIYADRYGDGISRVCNYVTTYSDSDRKTSNIIFQGKTYKVYITNQNGEKINNAFVTLKFNGTLNSYNSNNTYIVDTLPTANNSTIGNIYLVLNPQGDTSTSIFYKVDYAYTVYKTIASGSNYYWVNTGLTYLKKTNSDGLSEFNMVTYDKFKIIVQCPGYKSKEIEETDINAISRVIQLEKDTSYIPPPAEVSDLESNYIILNSISSVDGDPENDIPGAYIDTGIKINQASLKIETAFKVHGSDNTIYKDTDILGCILNTSWAGFRLYMDIGLYVHSGNTSSYIKTKKIDNVNTNKNNITISIVSGKLTVIYNEQTYTFTEKVNLSNSNNLLLFASGARNSTIWTGALTMYPTKIYIDNAVVRDYVPVKRKSDNEIGMYDKINNKFYGSVNNYKFIE